MRDRSFTAVPKPSADIFCFDYYALGLGADVRTDSDKSGAWQGLNAFAARLTRASGSNSGDGARATDFSRYGETALTTFAADLQSAKSSGGSGGVPAAAPGDDAAQNERRALLATAVAADWLACCAPQLHRRMLVFGGSRGIKGNSGGDDAEGALGGSGDEKGGAAEWQLWKRCWAQLAAGERTLGEQQDETRFLAQLVTQLMEKVEREA
jgi:hypothetical protein